MSWRALPLLLVAGCGFSTPLDLALNDLAQARCNALNRCSDGNSITHSSGTLQNCIVRSNLLFSAQVAAADTNLTALALEHCAARYPSYSCNDVITSNIPAGCLPVGLRGAGQHCTFHEQCSTGYCSGIRDALCGTCTAPPAPGDSCASQVCATGQICVSSTDKCQTGLGVGASCDAVTTVCGIDLACAGATGTSNGTCVAETTQQGVLCNNGTTYCDGNRGWSCQGIVTTTRTCQANILAEAGDPCGALPDGTYAICINGGACFTATGPMLAGQAGTCVAAAADGAACDTQHGPPCQYPARCVLAAGNADLGTASTAGTCTVPNASSCPAQ